jgi:7,8-dihydropterin-6-yl-methyl-4-(beta-D-ribofuranosyl)aminobenzene 5'-phosphate synthase
VLLHNANILTLDLNTIDAIVLSHPHYDHSGGLAKITPFIAHKPMYCVSDIFGNLMPQSDILKSHYTGVHFATKATEIIPGLWITKEQPTINTPLKTNEINIVAHLKGKGLVIIVGCSHHGLKTIISNAREIGNNQIHVYALVGGLHLKNSNLKEINQIIDLFKRENVKIVLPNHCTGYQAIKQFTDILCQQTEFIAKTASGTCHTGKSFEF